MNNNKSILLFVFSIILVAASFFSYSSSFNNDFVWDDRSFIIESPFVQTTSHWKELLIHNVGYSSGARNNFYRPVFSIFNMLNYVMGGGKPLAFHVTNVLLQSVCSVLVLVFIFLICDNVYIGFTTALLFALHPVQTQSITYISGRADPLYAIFILLSIICLIFSDRYKKNRLLAGASLFAFLLALLSKESAIIAPALIVLFFYVFSDGIQPKMGTAFKKAAPYFAVLGIYILTRISIFDFSKTAYSGLVLEPAPFYVRALTSFKAIFMYFRFLLFPEGFKMETYLSKARSILEGSAFLSASGVAAIAMIVSYVKKHDKLVFFGLA